ncbi:MAG: hypothetical protein KGH78_02160 [Candidatus Micrarchaeota archaeon]|nr:hypothetical protein [Candidatus Micrarchaeota archaeon]
MVPYYYFVAIGAGLLAAGLAGVVSSRHFIVTILSIEIIFAGAISALVGYYVGALSTNGSFFILLLALWAVASTEIIGIVAFYVYMRDKVSDFDLRKLTQMKG